MHFHKRLFELTQGVRMRVVLLILLGLTISATFVGQGIASALVISYIYAGEAWQAVLPLVGAIVLLLAMRAGLVWLREIGSMAAAAKIKERVRERAYAHLLSLGPGYLSHERTGAVQAALVDGIEALETYLGKYVPQMAVALIAPALILIYIATLDPVVALMIAACVIALPLLPRLWSKLLEKTGYAQWDTYATLKAQNLDSMQGMFTLKSFNAAKRRGEHLAADAFKLYRATLTALAVSLLSSGMFAFFAAAATAVAIGIGAIHLAEGKLDVPALLILLLLAGECMRPLLELEKYWHLGYTGVITANQIFEILDAKPLTVSCSREQHTTPGQRLAPALTPSGERATTAPPSIIFKDVWFDYGDGRPALRGLTFTAEAGKTTALVGRSGAGKTTAVSLSLRFFDPQRGQVLIDGQDARELTLDAVRVRMSVVSQDTYLFYGTIADNLRVGKPEATIEELRAVARNANILDFIESLPHGFQTLIGERGMKLSGGERQRIAIARALLKDAPILILDEPTSSVDAANEHEIQQALERLAQNRTTLVIAHRLSTIANADRIVVLDAGREVESGQHHELLARGSAYARLVAAQH